MRRELHDFVGGQQIAAGDRGAGRRHVAGFEVLGLIPDGFLTHRLAQPLGRLEVVHTEDLLHPGIGDEGRGARAVEIAELALGSARSAAKRSPGAFPGSCLTLQDRPELETISCHQPHGALHGFQTAQGGKLIEEEQRGRFQASCSAQRGHRSLREGRGDLWGGQRPLRVPCDVLKRL